MEQLGELMEQTSAAASKTAIYAATWLPTWGILTPSNSQIAIGTSGISAEKIIEQGLIPGGSTIEAEILVEASCHNCELLITFSPRLLEADPTPLNLALLEMELNKVTVTIASPKIIANRLALLQKGK